MREIKFRAWDGNKQEMSYDAIKLAIVIGSTSVESKTGNTHHFMQYTGLKDRNGVEIYEGDIIEDHNGAGLIEYVERYAAFRVNYKNGFAKWFYDYNLKGERESIGVIGNVYEYQELLGDAI